MFIQIKTHDVNTREQSVVHINAEQIGTIQFGEGDVQANFTVGPDAFTTKDTDSIKALRAVIGLSQTSPQNVHLSMAEQLDVLKRALCYQAQDAALGAMR